jgi:cysteine-rich repeat protein
VNDPLKIAAGQCGCGVADTDADLDGTANCNDACVNDPLKIASGVCGCGVADTDADLDGTANCNDACVNDPLKIAAGQCGCGVADTDADLDGTANCNDACVNDPLKIAAGQCGCGVADTDADADGTANCNDQCPNDAARTLRAPETCNAVDDDCDGTIDEDCPSGEGEGEPAPCGDNVLDCALGEECDDGNNQDGDGCSRSCRREAPVTRTWIGAGTATFADCAAWQEGTPPRDGDAVVVAAASSAPLVLPRLTARSLVLQAGTTTTVTLPDSEDGDFVASVELRGGSVRNPALGTAVVGDVRIDAGGTLVLAAGDLADNLAGREPQAALAVRGDLRIADGGRLDGSAGILMLLPVPGTTSSREVRANAPLIVGDLLVGPLGIEDERPTKPVELVVAAAVEVRRLTVIASHAADADATVTGVDGGALRTSGLRSLVLGAVAPTAAVRIAGSLPIAFTGDASLDAGTVDFDGTLRFAGTRGSARVARTDVAFAAESGLFALDANTVANLAATNASIVLRRPLRATTIHLDVGGQLFARGAVDVDTLHLNEGARFVAPASTTVRAALHVADGGRYVAGTGATTIGTAGTTVDVSGRIDLFDLTLVGASVNFGAGTALNIAGTWTARGLDATTRLALRGTGDDADTRPQWSVTPAGPVALAHLVVRDSRNLGPELLDPPDWVDEGNNTGWGALDECAGLVASAGNVTLGSDADVVAFNASNVQCVRGDLLLTGSITNAALPHVVRILGALRIENTTGLLAVSLPALGQAGSVDVSDNDALQELALPALTTSGSVDIAGNGALGTIDLGALVDVDGGVDISDNGALPTLDLGNLANVGGDIRIDDNDGLIALDLSGLATVGGDVTIGGNANLASLLLRATDIGGDLTLTDNDALVAFVADFLRSLGGSLAVANNDALVQIALNALQLVGAGVGVEAAAGVDTLVVGLPALTDVGDGVDIGAGAGGAVAVDLSSLSGVPVNIDGTVAEGSDLPVDGCSDGCAVCGDGRRDADETCDDGNTTDGDGCAATCATEPGYACAPDADAGPDRCRVDGDGDGIPDEDDNCMTATNADQRDTDHDRRGDACDDDDDDDGIPDDQDACPARADAAQGDVDGDGTGDACDTPPLPARCDGVTVDDDLDGDGLGDGCDDDVDGDGQRDDRDVCVGVADAAQIDTDGDGAGDACDDDDDDDGLSDDDDACPLVPGDVGCVGDVDGDGRGDEQDVCPLVSDPAQEDGDGDGSGDACDSDDDDDGFPDGVDVCPAIVDPAQTDRDGDGAGDACDACPDVEGGGLDGTCDDGTDTAAPAAVENCASSGPAPSFVGALLVLGALAGRRRRGVRAPSGGSAWLLVVAVIAVVGSAAGARAQATVRWTGAGSDSFGDATSWNSGLVPGALDTVVFDAGAPPCRLTSDVQVGAVQLDATINGSGRLTTRGFVVGPTGRVAEGVAVNAVDGEVRIAAGADVARLVVGGEGSVEAAGRVGVLAIGSGATTLLSDCRGAGELTLAADAVAVIDGPCTPTTLTQDGGQLLVQTGSAFSAGIVDLRGGITIVESALRLTGSLLRIAPQATFIADTATLVLDTPAALLALGEPLVVGSLQIVQPGAVITVTLGSSIEVLGSVVAVGTTDAPIVMRGETPTTCPPEGCATTWSLDADGTLRLENVLLRDAGNSGAPRALPVGVTDEGNNPGWQAPPPECGGRSAVYGPVVLDSDAAVDAFDRAGIACIAGDLIIRGEVTSVTLRTLEVVTGRILVERSTAQEVSVPALAAAGAVDVIDNPALASFDAPALATVDQNVTFTGNDALASLDVSGLTDVNGDFVFTDNDALTSLTLPPANFGGDLIIGDNEALQAIALVGGGTVGGDLTLSGNTALATVSLDLTSVGGDLELSQNPALTAIELPLLSSVGGDLLITGNDALVALNLSGLVDVGGDLLLGDNDLLTSVELPLLDEIGGSFIVRDNPTLLELLLTALTLVGGDVAFIGNSAFVTLSLPTLAAIGGDLVIQQNDALSSVALPALGTVGGDIEIGDNGDLQQVDLSALEDVGGDLTIDDNADATVVALDSLDDLEGVSVGGAPPSLPPGYACDATGACGPVCGDALLVDDEPCDDGNAVDGDGCSARCAREPGFVCLVVGSACIPDGDRDGVPDARDLCPTAADAAQRDTDADGLGDACDDDDDDDGVADEADLCPTAADARQTDDDDDGLGNVCDDGTAPAGDTDGDGFGDDVDSCPTVANASQVDGDGDGSGDACDDDDDGDGLADDVDPCRLVVGEACVDDRDGDGLADDVDPCPLVAGDDADRDDDGLGDACDVDVDGDVFVDDDDNCALTYNPSQTDRDDDGVGDACDRCRDIDDLAADEDCIVAGCNANGARDSGAALGLVLLLLRRRRR